MSAPLFTLTVTQAERELLADSLSVLRAVAEVGLAKPTADLAAIERLCERLSAQGEAGHRPDALAMLQSVTDFLEAAKNSCPELPQKILGDCIAEARAILAQPQAPEPVNAELLAALKRAWEDKNWMLNNRRFLNDECFDYMDRAIARAETALAAQKGPQ